MNVNDQISDNPLVSVIITCYNQGRFLREAIDSVKKQTYPHVEIIVVDDGSCDDTREVAVSYPDVHYVFQKNSGLSSARNTGFENSRGLYISFLDADDWLYPNAVKSNVEYLKKHPACAFVSGWHTKVDEWNYPITTEEQVVIENEHYANLLKGNYIGMHATVLYQAWLFSKYHFDTTLRACEDYDLYLKIARDYPIGNHGQQIAAYRIHGENMSSKIPFMLEHVLKVCDRQQPLLRDAKERKALSEGRNNWKEYYSEKLYKGMMSGVTKDRAPIPSSADFFLLLKHKPLGLTSYVRRKAYHTILQQLKTRLPDRVLRLLHRTGYYREYTPKPGNVEAGDFSRKTPFSYDFGFDRGGAIDRYYIENFLEANKSTIRGTVLEIGDNEYTLRYGNSNVLQSEILHVDSSNTKATYIGDITDVPQIPSEHFDCIIFTQTLHLIYDFKSALQTCYRILKPGGSLLLTVPGISHIDHGLWRDYWLWSFTDKSIRKLLLETFNEKDITVSTYGNVYVATAFLYGMGLPEFKKEFLKHVDPSYQVIISARAVKQ